MIKSFKSLLLADRKQKSNQQGFTIVEVMIVLAIAGLILAVVFVAVPALQKNQRNSARQNDVALFRTQLNQIIANGGGRVPANPAEALYNAIPVEDLNYIGLNNDGDAKGHTVAQTVATNSTPPDLPGDGRIYRITSFLAANGTLRAGQAINLKTTTGSIENSIIVLKGLKCASNDGVLSDGVLNGTDLSVTGINRNTVAFVYSLEDDTNGYCVDDIN